MMTESARWHDADLAALRLQGLEHLNRLRSGEATERDEAEFLAWRAQSRAHEEAFRSAAQLQRLVREAERAVRLCPANDIADAASTIVPFVARPVARFGRRAFLGSAIAASVAGMLGVGQSLDLVPSPSELGADYRTGTGERKLVRLAGGATIDLNTRTSIALHDDPDGPAVELISGEAILATGSGAGGRVAVLAGAGRSVGRHAHFSARRDGGEVCITCLAGVVDVAWMDQRRLLRAQDQVRYNDAGIGAVAATNARLVTAWQNGTLIFRAMPMRRVIAEINRYRPGRVVLANDALGDRPLSGTYYVDRLDEFFSQAELAFGVHVRRLPAGVVILT